MSVRHALLALLSEGPKYGLQLRQEFEARTGQVWPLNVGQVYTTLQRLERDGLVESDDTALITGRELLGYPKKLGEISFDLASGEVHAVASRRGAPGSCSRRGSPREGTRGTR